MVLSILNTTSPHDGKSACRQRFLLFARLWFISFLLLAFIPSAFALTGVAGDLAPRSADEENGPDSELTSADVIVLQRMVLGIIVPTSEELLVGDVAPVGQPDGVLDMADVLVLQRAVLGLVTLPPIETGPPDPIDPAAVTVSDSTNGQVTVTGAAGGAPGGGSVTITNTSTGESVTVSANSDGSFTAQIAALGGDHIAIVVRNRLGEASDAAGFEVNRPATFNALTLAIAQPASGASVAQEIQVSGTYEGPVGTGITVNGVVADVIGLRYVAEISLQPGANTITATATSPDGSTTSSSVNVNVAATAESPIHVTIDPPGGTGFAPLDVYFFVASTNGEAIQRIQLDADGDGTIDLDSARGEIYLGDWIYYPYYIPGIYHAKFTVTLVSGSVHFSSHTITVGNLNSMDLMLRGIYQRMLERLRVRDIDGALKFVSGGVNDHFRAVFTVLDPNLPTVVDTLGTLRDGNIGSEMAEYLLVREEDSQMRAYYLYFLRGEDGVWRIDGM